ncbi:tRNA-(MS[2]IO[6]A)-hydroxylase MiaE-like protein [Haloactinospora alba]|uniref:tRNA-(MS[2]IO[6]A)-hydroxylase MiaE-like protein n=1 Tax=Haloactinospora alba TaxID=405555 RepID=A0A543NF62_9ACTN|nr:ferritin-like fold-containing protein [Haloactinospora alba]TQN30474.1 tRNA-(MS[2]IO[6]A)-hydroxylase MiaE-like protein [Haloactinospora alba]
MTNGSVPTAGSGPGEHAERGVVDLLGLLAYAELVAFFRTAEHAELAPTLEAKGKLAGLAAGEYANHERLYTGLVQRGADPEEAMRPFVAPLDAWHARTEPQDWLESLVKIYVGLGIAGDFYRKVAELTDEGTRELATSAVADTQRAEFIAPQVRAAVEADPALGGRLSLWARRLVGEALSQAQSVAASRMDLAVLLAGGAQEDTEQHGDGSGSGDLATVSRMFATLTDAHNTRLAAMGLGS